MFPGIRTLCYQDTISTLQMLLGYDTVYILYNENTQDRTLSQDIAPGLKLCNYCVLINYGAQ